GAQAQDLRFLTRYRLTWGDALGGVGETVFYEGILLLLALLVLPLPGVYLLLVDHAYLVRQKRSIGDGRSLAWDPAAWWGAALALGVAGWPILWVLVTLVWAHLTGWLLALFVIGGWIAAAYYWWTESSMRL
ncbi:MAG: hypothetical protein P8169_13280, partial [Chloroflexota bacterium]